MKNIKAGRRQYVNGYKKAVFYPQVDGTNGELWYGRNGSFLLTYGENETEYDMWQANSSKLKEALAQI